MSLPRTSLEQWAALAAVVDHGGYTQAAEALNRSQSAVSYSVAKLQELLDLPLLTIEGRKAVLTAEGEALLRRARPLLRDIEALECLARNLKQGWEPHLNLVVDAAFPRPLLLKIVAELQQLCPSTQLRLDEVVLSGAEEAIESGTADIVVTAHVPPGVLAQWLCVIPFVAVARPDHPLFELEGPLAVEQLSRHTQSVVRDSGSKRPRDSGWLGATVRYTVSSLEASLATVTAGLAYGWLPEHLVDAPLQSGALKRLPLASGSTRTVPLHLVSVRGDLAGPAARSAIECFERHAPRMAEKSGVGCAHQTAQHTER